MKNVRIPAKNSTNCSVPLVQKVGQRKGHFLMEDNRPLFAGQGVLLKTMQMARAKSCIPTSGVIQARVPNYEELVSLKGKVAPDVLRAKLHMLVNNMIQRGELVGVSDIDEIMAEIIDKEGNIDREDFEWLMDDVTDKAKVYQDVNKAHAKLDDTDTKLLRQTLENAKRVVDDVRDNKKLIKCVFGGKTFKARWNYGKIRNKLEYVAKNVETVASTDYNGDDDQLGIGGYANERAQLIHFKQIMCGWDIHSIPTAIHECAHLSDGAIGDYGYMGTPGFESMSEDLKINNAAHYEVVPYWRMGLDCPYAKGEVFTFKSGEDKRDPKKAACDYFQNMVNKSFNYADRIREIHVARKAASPRIQDYSEHMGLTIHLRDDKSVVLLDLTLAQEITRVFKEMFVAMKNNDEVVDESKNFEGWTEYFKNKTIDKFCEREGIDESKMAYLAGGV